MRNAGNLSKRGSLLAASAIATLTLAAPSQAHAQEAGASNSDEIVVTAQRREQNIQDVPISMESLSGEDLRNAAVRTLDDAGTGLANIQIYQDKGASQPNWTIRGVALLDYNVNNTPSTAVHVDDVYQSSLVLGAGGIFDLDRIEVLRGPQSGLYGRNAIGGVVQAISNRANPGDHDGYLTADYGSWGRYRVEGAQSFTLSDQAALRIAAFHDGGTGDGWQTSLPTGEQWGDPNRTSARAILSLLPTDELRIDVKGYYLRDQSETTLATATGVYDLLGPLGAFCPSVIAGIRDQANCATLAQLLDPTQPFPSVQAENGSTTLSSPINQMDNEQWGGTLNIEADIGELTLTSVTGYDEFNFGFTYDYDATPLRLAEQQETARLTQFNQEFRLASPTTGSLRWLLGLQYAHSTFDEFRFFDMTDNLVFNPIFTSRMEVSYNQETDYFGLFGQVEYDLSDRLTFIGALRYSNEETTYRNGEMNTELGPWLDPGTGDPIVNLSSDYDLDDQWTGSARLTYQVDDDRMLYGSISRGYKSGGIFGAFPIRANYVTPYDEEFVLAYEVGFNSEWFDRRLLLNMSLFYYDHSDIQAFQFSVDPITTFVSRLVNVGDGYNQGFEIEAGYRLTDSIRIGGTVGYLEDEITDSDLDTLTLDGQLISWEGLDLPYSPDWTYSAYADADFPVGNGGLLNFHIDYAYRTTVDKPESIPERVIGEVPAYGTANAQISLTTAQDWRFAVWSRNLFDESYLTSNVLDGLGSYYQVPGEPRSIGVSIGRSW